MADSETDRMPERDERMRASIVRLAARRRHWAADAGRTLMAAGGRPRKRYSAPPSEKFSTRFSSASASGGRRAVPANESATMRATALLRR